MDIANLTVDQLLERLTHLVFWVAVARLGMVWLEGALAIWIHRTPDSVFWDFWAKLMQTIDYMSLSIPRAPEAIRALYKRQQMLKAQAAEEEPATGPTVPTVAPDVSRYSKRDTPPRFGS